jgi:hypothetical protein
VVISVHHDREEDMEPLMINLEEVSRRSGVPLHALRLWRAQGTSPIRLVRVGRRVMALRSEVDEWVEELFAEAAK